MTTKTLSGRISGREYKKFTYLNLLFSFSLALVGPLLAPYLVKRGFSPAQLSLIFSVFPFVNIIFMPLFGRLADQINKKIIIWLGICLEILALVLYVISAHWYILIAARFLDALAASLVALLVLAKIEDNIRYNKQRGRQTGKYLSWGFLGELIGPLVGAWLADYFFIRAPFIMAILILFLLAFYLLISDLEGLPLGHIKLPELNWWETIKKFLSFPQLKGMAIMGMVMHATNPAMKLFLPIIIVNKLKMDYRAIGVAMFVYGVTHLAQAWFGRLSDLLGHHRAVMGGSALMAVSLGLVAWAPSYVWLLILLFVQGIGASLWNVSAWSLMSVIGEKRRIEAQVLTSYFSIAKVGSLISFIAGAWLVSRLGLSAIFIVNAFLILGAIILARPLLNLKNLK